MAGMAVGPPVAGVRTRRGSAGGKARAAKLSAEERRAIARKAIQARWRATAAEREARRRTMTPVEVGDVTLESYKDRLRLTIAVWQPTAMLTDVEVQALIKALRRWRRWLARRTKEEAALV